jgi:16S rRNA (adenine1518-N6/adenine1519-N6)-dimethyltransferase
VNHWASESPVSYNGNVPKNERPRNRAPSRPSSVSRPQRRPPLGQHFLTDRSVERRILESLDLSPQDFVLEIGAGRGNMTELLASRAGSVLAVEIDTKLVALLRRKFEGNSRVEVREADILELPIAGVTRAAGREKIKVYGSLPYYITSPCLMHLFRYHTWIEEIVVMVQEEVAQRIVSRPGASDYGLLSLTCQYYAKPRLLFSVGPKSFSPPPEVRSAVVRMQVSPQRQALGIAEGDEKAFWNLVRRAFSQKRKTLFNNWKGTCEEGRLRAALGNTGIDSRARAEALSLEQFAALFKMLQSVDSEGRREA